MAKKRPAKRDLGLQAGPGTCASPGTADSPHTGGATRAATARELGVGVVGGRVSKRKKEPDKQAEPPSPPTGRELTVPGQNGGTLIRHPEGSNGGVHRGPDLLPFRRNVVRAIIFN